MAYYALGRALMPQKKFADAAGAFAKCRDLYVTQAGRQFSNQQEAQQYRRERITELDEIIRQYQQGPQTTRTIEAVRQLVEDRRLLQENMQRNTSVSMEMSVPSFVSLALGSAYFDWAGSPMRSGRYKATVTADPKTGEAFQNLAVVYMETGRLEEAENAVKAAEKTGFKVNPALKDDLAAARKK